MLRGEIIHFMPDVIFGQHANHYSYAFDAADGAEIQYVHGAEERRTALYKRAVAS